MVIGLLAACADLNSTITAPLPDHVTYENDIKPILDRQCIRCHGEQAKQMGLDWRNYETITNSGYFTAGDPNSWILSKLNPSKGKMYIYLNNIQEYNLIYQWVVVDSLAER